jgi:hypothetical protein
MSVGEMHNYFVIELTSFRKSSNGNLEQAALRELKNLRSSNIISIAEAGLLRKALQLVSGKLPPEKQLPQLYVIQTDMFSQKAVGEVAATILSVAIASVESANRLAVSSRGNKIAAKTTNWGSVAKADVAGAIGGASAGGRFGPYGALIGGLIGAVAFSAADFWQQHGD